MTPAPDESLAIEARLDASIAAHTESAFSFLERLVAAPSVVGSEQAAEEILADELESLGFEIERLPVPADISSLPGAGVPSLSYTGRYDVIGRRPGRTDRSSLLLNGHIDVVPADEPTLWASPPFKPTRRDGWLYGRGAGDMKCGFAMGVLAVRAILDVAPDAVSGPLTFVAAIEEECTGNGSLAAASQGVLADAVVVLEPTNLDLMLGGIGVLWLEVVVTGRAAHASSPGEAVNAIEAALPLLVALRGFERQLNQTERDARMPAAERSFALNIGRVWGGDWGSTVPAVARFEVRVGFPLGWTADEAEARVRACLAEASNRSPWLRANPPSVRASGFRAEGYGLAADAPLAVMLGAAHRAAHGADPRPSHLPSTTDARIYLNRFDTPAICYGPRAVDIHGINEAVELASIVDGSRTLARFLTAWYNQPTRTEK
jgi:acetylornithine deacetylase